MGKFRLHGRSGGEIKPPESMTNAQTLERILDMAYSAPSGAFAEIGVAQGGASYYFHKIAEDQGRQLHLFDYRLGDDIKKWCPKAVMHEGRYPETWVNMYDIAFCFYDIADLAGTKFLLDVMPSSFVKNGIALFYPFNRGAVDPIKYPDWGLDGAGGMRYPRVENRGWK